jgi:ATP/maltotriose-dependent transcriptional regulator MalT
VFEEAGDEKALARAWHYLGDVHWAACRWAARGEALEHALVHARRAGDAAGERDSAFHFAVALVHGPTPVAEVDAWAQELAQEAERNPGLAAIACTLQSFTNAARGDFAEARRLSEQNIAAYRELGQHYRAFGALAARARIEEYAGDYERAAEFLHESCEGLEAVGETNTLSTFSGNYGLVLTQLGRFDEAEARAATSRRLAATDDVASQVLWRIAQARVLVRRDRFADAEALAREAEALLEQADPLDLKAQVALTLGAVLGAAGRKDEAEAAIRGAVSLFEQKGLLPLAQRARMALAEVTA